jgi:hypothetical protein
MMLLFEKPFTEEDARKLKMLVNGELVDAEPLDAADWFPETPEPRYIDKDRLGF